MKTEPNVSRFAERAKIVIQPNTLAKVKEEGSDYKFTCISRGHYACDHANTTHIIIEKDGKIGCSCADMPYRCTNNSGCKHIAAFLALDVPPQKPASGELIKKLMLMGWVGGKDDLHPAELVKPAHHAPSKSTSSDPPSVICPHCKTRARRRTQEEADAWLDKHLLGCPKNPDNNAPKEPPAPPHVVDEPGIYPDEDSWKPDEDEADPPHEPEYPDHVQPELPDPTSEDYSNCKNVEHAATHRIANIPDGSKLAATGNPVPIEPQPVEEPNTGGAIIASKSVDNLVPTNLAAALCNMQKIDLLAVTDSNNPFHNAKYADLASVWAAIRNPLTDNGLAVIQTTEPYQDGITVVTTLLHTSGESFTARLSCEIPKSKPDKNGQIKPNIQGLGSTITYLRRYSLTAMVGVAPIDDDGEAAMGRGDRR